MTLYVTKVRGLKPLDGIIGGAIAGAVQTLIAMFYGLFNGKSFWHYGNLLGTLAGNPAEPAGPNGAMLIGIVVNIVFLSLMGLLFALVARTLEAKALVWSALAYGLIVWAIGYFLVLPSSGVGWSDELRNGAGALTLASSMLLYGSILGAYLSRRQRRELVSHS